MRMIGRVGDEASASLLCDFLYSQGIENEVRPEPDGTWGIWVYSEQQLDAARSLAVEFAQNPNDPRFRAAIGEAGRQRSGQQREDREMQARTYTAGRVWSGSAQRLEPLTTALIIVSVGVAILSRLGNDFAALNPLMITRVEIAGQWVTWNRGLPEIHNGQVWRLITPMFIHFGILHILFNMMWLKDLGGMVERAKGTWFLAILVTVVAAASSLGQYALSGPMFGGMSGVIYGLFGYVWMKGKYNPGCGMGINQQTVTWMLVWFALCFTGLLGNIGNGAHGIGLVVGVVWGFLGARIVPAVRK